MKNRNIEKISFDLKAGLEFYIPSILTLICGEIRWTSLTKIFENRFQSYSERYIKGEHFELRTTLYSICVSAAKGVETNIQFLGFIDCVFKSLSNLLNKKEKNLIKSNIANLLQYDNGFLNYLGELCILNSILLGGKFSLEMTEYKVKKNCKGIDFLFKQKETNELLYVEVVNIELRSDKLTSHDNIAKFLQGKFQEKLDDTDKSGFKDYILVPVLWGGHDNVDNTFKVKNFYEQTDFKMDRVEIPKVYMQLERGGKVFNRFGSILECMTIEDIPE